MSPRWAQHQPGGRAHTHKHAPLENADQGGGRAGARDPIHSIRADARGGRACTAACRAAPPHAQSHGSPRLHSKRERPKLHHTRGRGDSRHMCSSPGPPAPARRLTWQSLGAALTPPAMSTSRPAPGPAGPASVAPLPAAPARAFPLRRSDPVGARGHLGARPPPAPPLARGALPAFQAPPGAGALAAAAGGRAGCGAGTAGWRREVGGPPTQATRWRGPLPALTPAARQWRPSSSVFLAARFACYVC